MASGSLELLNSLNFGNRDYKNEDGENNEDFKQFNNNNRNQPKINSQSIKKILPFEYSNKANKSIKLLRNGDKFFSGQRYVINARKCRHFDMLLDDISDGHFGAVRSIHTPLNGHKIKTLEDMEDGKTYVVSGNGRFVRLNYLDISEKRSNQFSHVKLPLISKQNGDISFKPPQMDISKKLIIHVYRNGDVVNPPVKVLLQKYTLASFDAVLNEITTKINLVNGAVLKLYTIEGEQIDSPSKLVNGNSYVGGNREKFKRLDYLSKETVNGSPKSNRKGVYKLPPIKEFKSYNSTNYLSSNNSRNESKSNGKINKLNIAENEQSKESNREKIPLRSESEIEIVEDGKNMYVDLPIDLQKVEGVLKEDINIDEKDEINKQIIKSKIPIKVDNKTKLDSSLSLFHEQSIAITESKKDVNKPNFNISLDDEQGSSNKIEFSLDQSKESPKIEVRNKNRWEEKVEENQGYRIDYFNNDASTLKNSSLSNVNSKEEKKDEIYSKKKPTNEVDKQEKEMLDNMNAFDNSIKKNENQSFKKSETTLDKNLDFNESNDEEPELKLVENEESLTAIDHYQQNDEENNDNNYVDEDSFDKNESDEYDQEDEITKLQQLQNSKIENLASTKRNIELYESRNSLKSNFSLKNENEKELYLTESENDDEITRLQKMQNKKIQSIASKPKRNEIKPYNSEENNTLPNNQENLNADQNINFINFM